ncbi:MAG: response regulator [Saprospiraceae bacterium]|nr:response regulator [Lewinella sp.]
MKPKSRSAFLVVALLLLLPLTGIGQFARDSLQDRLNNYRLDPLEEWQTLQLLIELDREEGWDSTLSYSQRALQLAEGYLPDKIAASALDVAGALEHRGAYRQMTDMLYKALDRIDRDRPSLMLGRIYLDLGHIFFRQQQHQKSKNYFLRAYQIHTALRDTQNMVVSLNNISSSYDSISLDSARYYLETALKLALAGGVDKQLPRIYNNLGTQIDFGDHPTPEAMAYFRRGYWAAVTTRDTAELLAPATNLGFSFVLLEQYDSAVYYLTLLEHIFDPERDELNLLLYAFQGLAQVYETTGRPEKALEYYKQYTATSDTLQRRVFASEINDIEAKYQTEEKEAQLARQELELERQTYLRDLILFVGLALITAIAGVLLYLRNRQRMRAREAELSLEAARNKAQQLRELDELKSNFFANISHEFRTPLTLLLGPLTEMKAGTFRGDPKRYFSMMHRNGQRLLDLINQLLDLSKLDSGKMELKLRPGNLSRFLTQLAGAMQSWADKKDIDYHVTIKEEIPVLLFDHDKLEKIVTNLLSNALKFTPEGGTVSLSVLTEEEEDQVLVTMAVTDSGQGISAEELPQIFDRFYQTGRIQDGMAGTGIGLALTRELIHLQDGTVEVDSKPGNGTCFTVYLPLTIFREPIVAEIPEKEVSLYQAAELVKPALPREIGKSDQPILLIVEDNPDLRAYVRDQLGNDYRIVEAENGEAGFNEAVTRIPDLIITDVMMPKMTGTELTAKLKQDERSSHIPVIMLTAKAEQEDKLEGLETGADDYLLKPFDARELRVRVRNLIEQRERLRAKFAASGVLSPKDVAVSSVDEKFLNRLMEIIEENMDNEAFSVEEMSRRIGLSRSQLHRKLKALTGEAPNVLLRTIRLHRAHQLLLQKAGNASEVAFMTGFTSVSYFSRCFKSQYGKTPTEVLGG